MASPAPAGWRGAYTTYKGVKYAGLLPGAEAYGSPSIGGGYNMSGPGSIEEANAKFLAANPDPTATFQAAYNAPVIKAPTALQGYESAIHSYDTGEIDAYNSPFQSSPTPTAGTATNQTGTPTMTTPSGASAAAAGLSTDPNDILALADVTNAYNLNAATNQYRALPGYESSLAQVGTNIGQMVSGQLPADVQAQIAQQAAERGVAQGGFRNADYLKALGLNSLQMQQQGQTALNAATAALPHPALYDPSRMYMTPQQQQELAIQRGQLGVSEYNAQTNRMQAMKPNPAKEIVDRYSRPNPTNPTGYTVPTGSGGGVPPTPTGTGRGTLTETTFAPDANAVIDINLPETDAYWAYINGVGPDPYTDTSQYFDYNPPSPMPDMYSPVNPDASVDETYYYA